MQSPFLPQPGSLRRRIGRGLPGTAAFLLTFLLAVPAGATLNQITVDPTRPMTCDSVSITVHGDIPGSCYEITSATIRGPEELPCAGPLPCRQFWIQVVVQEPDPSREIACTAQLVPYERTFKVGRLPFGSYFVEGEELLVPFVPDSTAGIAARTVQHLTFTVYPDTDCVVTGGCYILSLSPSRAPDAFCADTAPGGTACLDLQLYNAVPVAGLQTTLEVLLPDGSGSAGSYIQPISVETTDRTHQFETAWTTEAGRTKLLLFSTSGALIPEGFGPAARICFRVAGETPPGSYIVPLREEIVSDSTGNPMPQCPTFARIVAARICVAVPGCDLNDDGMSNVLDVIRLVRCAVEPDPSSACPDSVRERADCNGDLAVDILDVVCCVRKILQGTNTPVPVALRPGAASEPGSTVGFEGAVRWTGDQGTATIAIGAATGFGGAQFVLNALGAPASITDVRLLDASSADRLDWVSDGQGGARVMVYSTDAARPAGALRLAVSLKRVTDPDGWGSVRLFGAISGTSEGMSAPITMLRTELDVSSAPVAAPRILGSQPNPFRDQTEISFVIPRDARATLRVYDTAGRLVRTLVDGPATAGAHRIAWTGSDAAGRAAPAGIYFLKLDVNGVRSTGRLMLLR